MNLAEIPHGYHTEEGGKRKDRKRLYGASREASAVQKKRRVPQRQARLVESKKLWREKWSILC